MRELKESVATMTTGIDTLLEQAYDIKRRSEDFTLRKPNLKRNIWFENDGTLTFNSDEGKEVNAGLSDYAICQLGNKINVPGQYIINCFDKGYYDLAQDNINTWINQYKGGFKFRQTDDHLRAVLSPRYSAYDSEQILSVIKDNVDMNEYSIKGSFISEERLHARFVNNEMMNINGEDVFPAIFLDSSDVGRNTLIITFGIYKQVCTNGLIVARADGILYKQRHIGIDPEEFEYSIAASLDNIPTLVENAKEWIEKARTESLNLKEMTAYLKSMHIAEKEHDNIIDLMDKKYDRSRWGFINSITEYAQTYTLDKREELETAVGRILVAA